MTVSARRFGPVLLGAAAAAGTLLAIWAHTQLRAGPTERPWSLWRWYLPLATVTGLVGYAFGLPSEPRRRLSAGITCASVPSVVAISALALQTLAGRQVLPRFVLVTMVPAVALSFWFAWLHQQRAEERFGNLARVLLVSSTAERVEVPDPSDPGGPWVEQPYRGVGVIHVEDIEADPAWLAARSAALGVTLLVLSEQARRSAVVIEVASQLHESGVRVRSFSAFSEEWLGRMSLPDLGPMALMFDIVDVHPGQYPRVKRFVDLVAAVSALPVLLLALLCIPIGNLFGNRGPLFYRQARIGRGGTEFTIIKFRTMRPEAALGGRPASVADSRVTPFGRVLRRWHIDELPQLINVLRGDLSVVGPRPEQPFLVARYAAKVPEYRLRHAVRPGLTGWAQVKYRYGEDEADAIEKLQYDLYYLRHQSLVMDLQILIRTVRHVAHRGGR